jgi:hypothetical protein
MALAREKIFKNQPEEINFINARGAKTHDSIDRK